MSATPPLLRLSGIRKSFGATRALGGVDLVIEAGKVHALVGENGAGKSTLMKILSGAYAADAGRVLLEGQPVSLHSPADARRLGIAMIYQELNLAPHLTVEANMTLGVERARWGVVRPPREEIRQALKLMGHGDLSLDTPVGRLSLGQQQVVEIARALLGRARVIVMDEPTSSLSAANAQALFDIIRRLRDNGAAIVYISHFLEEVFEIADTFTVLRDGLTVGSGHMSQADISSIIRLMVGRDLAEMFPRVPHSIGEPLLRVESLSGDPTPCDVGFTLRRGEILGVAGLVGAGRSEMLRGIFGLDPVRMGRAVFEDEETVELHAMRPDRALRHGLDFLSENRKEEGLAINMTVTENLTLSCVSRFARARGRGLLRPGAESQAASRWVRDLNIRCRSPRQSMTELSGGNQQKVALARLLEHGGDILLLDEPTRGIDVGSKVEIYQTIGRLAARGKSIVFVSSYLPELLGVCDSLAVMHRGCISEARPVGEWDEHSIMRMATTGRQEEVA